MYEALLLTALIMIAVVGLGILKTALTPPQFSFTARNGKITEAELHINDINEGAQEAAKVLHDRKVHEISDWKKLLPQEKDAQGIGTWVNGLFGVSK